MPANARNPMPAISHNASATARAGATNSNAPTAAHPLNRNLFIADNLTLLQRLDNESVDLICIDPPFAKNQTFVGALKPPLTDDEQRQELDMMADWGIHNARQAAAAGIEWPYGQNYAKFKDIWRWENDVHEDWIARIESDHAALAKVIDATRYAHSEDTAAYLAYMAIRLIEMHRILKPTGSIYLHCDYNANAYLRMTLDAIFGDKNIRNEIAWCYTGPANVRRYFPRKHDTILFYAKSADATFNSDSVRVPYVRVTGTGHNSLARGKRTDEEVKKLEEEYGRRGKVPEDYWTDIAAAGHMSRQERSGYPTQKPVALAERIILASTNPGDVVLDCFAGCAYVPVAAERNNRQWIACDISPRALTVLRRQFAKFHYSVDGAQATQTPTLIVNANVITRAPSDLPTRTDADPTERQDIKELPERKYKVPSSIIPEKEMLEFLLELSDYKAWCCGFANRRPDGTIVRTTNNFHLDHIDPRSKEGSNQITNRAPLCPTHNIRKNSRRVHLADYREEIAYAGEMLVDTLADLVNLPWAAQQALDYYALARAKSGYQPTFASA